ncbi:MAG: DUF2914 domain-containing protein [bacterium]
MTPLLQNILSFYDGHKKSAPVLFFFGGFTWDSFTLKRIDRWLDNLVLLSYILLLGGLIVLVNLIDIGKIKNAFILKYRTWYPLGLQFFMGGLFSAYVVFYFQSASLSKTSLFVGLLVILLVANEFLEKRLRNLYLLISLYFLASFSFFIFFIPVTTKAMNVYTFQAGGLLSLILVAGILFLFNKQGILRSRKQVILTGTPVAILFVLLNLLYTMNWIPPVPLSLRSGGIYHHVSKHRDSDLFVLKFEQPKWFQFWKKSDGPFHYEKGDTVHCFTAIFAPTRLTKRIFHHWQKYFPRRKKWVTTDRLGYFITGYRDGGYRGVTRKVNVSPGKWRVDVETEEGLLLGRINFKIKAVASKVPLKTVYR